MSDGNNYHVSDLVYKTPKNKMIQGLFNKQKMGEKLDLLDIKHRVRSTEGEISKSLNE